MSESGTLLRTLIDDWQYLTVDERKALIGDIFEEIRADENGIEDFLPREVWKQYMRAVVPEDANQVPTERKTGLEPAVRARTLRVRDGGLDVVRRAA